ncbi:histidine ammonia-lyase [Loktanella atrilutea]|uniref:Aromatic ammonia-lyase n=1 Tax=Loktanella atrilutea TaxID=366533 RepID=AAL_LOKAT|nr:aromatic amino acid ammonia-lyase [Loktanella atrilutea]WCK11274.1 phenylalanine ammonia-lyase [synthetic construct]SHE94330.1 histidine ammonia-lyase [Loktanella atrilutea]
MTITLDGASLTLADIDAVARGGAKVAITGDADVLARVHGSRDVIARAVERGEEIYGVTTLFGGMADVHVTRDQLIDVQKIALWQHKSTTGPRLPDADVRAAMLLRANSLMRGASGVRIALIERLVAFLNAGASPQVYQRGSIGASGDLVPLTYIGASILGLSPEFLVDLDGETLDCHTVLAKLGFTPMDPDPKEGLALNNGTGACTGVAANVMARALDAATMALGVHALFAQALLATDQSFDPYIHAQKPHPGQVWSAARMAELLTGGRTIRSEAGGDRARRKGDLIQDRYGIRCLPQFFGPIVDGLSTAARQIETEANTANDNPLINPATGETFHTGNFLAQYTAIAMDSTRYLIGLMCKHIDSQIALMITPAFSNGLTPALVGNMDTGVNVGLKSLHIGMNQMSTQISYLGQSVADRFPTHAEMYNQNINSQAMNAANLARDQMDVTEHFLAAALLTGVQAVEVRSRVETGSCDARDILSPATVPLYEAARVAAAGRPDKARTIVWDDMDGFLQPKVEGLLADIGSRGNVHAALQALRSSLDTFRA